MDKQNPKNNSPKDPFMNISEDSVRNSGSSHKLMLSAHEQPESNTKRTMYTTSSFHKKFRHSNNQAGDSTLTQKTDKSNQGKIGSNHIQTVISRDKGKHLGCKCKHGSYRNMIMDA